MHVPPVSYITTVCVVKQSLTLVFRFQGILHDDSNLASSTGITVIFFLGFLCKSGDRENWEKREESAVKIIITKEAQGGS